MILSNKWWKYADMRHKTRKRTTTRGRNNDNHNKNNDKQIEESLHLSCARNYKTGRLHLHLSACLCIACILMLQHTCATGVCFALAHQVALSLSLLSQTSVACKIYKARIEYL